MVIKIVGVDDKLVKYTSCQNCAKILKYTPDDVEQRAIKDMCDCEDIVDFIRCPNCGINIFFWN